MPSLAARLQELVFVYQSYGSWTVLTEQCGWRAALRV